MSFYLAAANGTGYNLNGHGWSCLRVLALKAGFTFPSSWKFNDGELVDFATCAELARKINRYMGKVEGDEIVFKEYGRENFAFETEDGRGFESREDWSVKFYRENVDEFVTFLRECGGFELW